jgi:hypothetical protein
MVLASSRGAARDSSNTPDALAATPDGYGVVTILPIRTERRFLWMTNSWVMPRQSCDWRRGITELF